MTTLSKEEYLKRYLDPVKSGDYKKKKKKSKEKAKQTRGMKIVDDDVAWSKIAPDDDIPDDLLMREEMPKVEEIDERTQEEKAMDLYRKGDKWKMVDSEKTAFKSIQGKSSTARHDSDSDMDIPRKTRHDSSEPDVGTPPRKQISRSDSGSDLEIERRPRKRHDSSSDSMNSGANQGSKTREFTKSSKSVHRRDYSDTRSIKKENIDHGRSASPGSKRKKEKMRSDSDLELPRSHKYSSHQRKNGTDRSSRKIHSSSSKSKTMLRRHDSSDSDLELPRVQRHRHTGHRHNDSSDKNNAKLKQSSDSDIELPRRKRGKDTHSISREENADSDLELPRRNSTHDNKKATSGAVGGLTSREDLKRKLQQKRMESDIDNLARDSRNAVTVHREKSGKKRDLQKEKIQKDAEDEEKEKRLKKYNEWGKGVTQSEMKDYALEDLIHEANKPLARYADDADLDAFQRSQMRDGDPMAEYLAKKRSKETGNAPTMPKYRGPAPAPNRYGIPPGYRWDGVDRSNGFEKKYFNSKSERGALKQEAYKWSVEDM